MSDSNSLDLVKRLRTMARIGWHPIGDEAADEIDRLRAELGLAEVTIEDQKRVSAGLRAELSRANEQLETARDQHGYLVSAAAFDEVCEERDRYRDWHDAVMAQPEWDQPTCEGTYTVIERPQPLEVKP